MNGVYDTRDFLSKLLTDIDSLCSVILPYFRATKDEIVVPQPNLRPATIPSSLMVEVIVCEARLKPLAVYECLEKQFSWKKILIFVNDKLVLCAYILLRFENSAIDEFSYINMNFMSKLSISFSKFCRNLFTL